jgi:hypothetical protein
MSKDINVESWWDGVEVDISGPLEGLRELVEAFEETLGAGENASFRLRRMKNVFADPPRVVKYPTRLEIRITEGPVMVEVEDDDIIVFSGSSEMLEYIPLNVATFYDPPEIPDVVKQDPRYITLQDLLKDVSPSRIGKHTHIEYWTDHPWLSPDAVPLIVGVLED